MRGLESLPAVVRQDDPKKVLGAGAEPEGDEGIVAERRGQREASELRGSVEDGHPVQIVRLPVLDEVHLPHIQPRSSRLLDLYLDIAYLTGADADCVRVFRDQGRRSTDV